MKTFLLRPAVLVAMLCAALPAFAQPSVNASAPRRRPDGASAPSYELVSRAWKAFQKKDYYGAMSLANRCVHDYAGAAQAQQAELKEPAPEENANDYWALNDVATSLFIKGRCLEKMNQDGMARMVYAEVLRRYPFGQCWDPKDVFWSVGGAAQDRLLCIDLHIDFGDYKSSTLTKNAWDAFNRSNFRGVEVLTEKCIQLFGNEAARQQATLRDFPSLGLEWDYWALNDVGTCLYIKGQALLKQRKDKEAEEAFRRVMGTYGYALCWDAANECFWRVADAARKVLFKISKT